MTPGFWGSLSALSWGTADFLARFTGRAVGYVQALLGMLLISSVLLSLWVVISGARFVWTLPSLPLLLLAGVCFLGGTLLLYMSFVWGPVTLAAPIEGSYPALVVLIAVALGSRPSLLQWIGTIVTLAGVVVVARGGIGAAPGKSAGTEAVVASDPGTGGPSRTTQRSQAAQPSQATQPTRATRRPTAGAAAAAAVVFAVMISATQETVPMVGSLQTLWFPRVFALALLIVILTVGWLRGRPRPAIPRRWWPVLGIQGSLDAGGYLFLYLAATGPNPEIAAMTSSAYYVVTILLGRIVLKERMNLVQMAGIVLVFGGVLLLSV
jgi:drug/metabolite transporter (DMT)-like permease